MEDLLVWQYEQIVKELILLQEHIADPSCPCETANEYCVRKHLMAIEAYAEETLPMEEDGGFASALEQLAAEAKQLRRDEESLIMSREKDDHPVSSDWPRNWRKRFEKRSISLDT